MNPGNLDTRFLDENISTTKNMGTKFFRNSNFSDFLGIKSDQPLRTVIFGTPYVCNRNLDIRDF